jgi:hypothetical protein
MSGADVADLMRKLAAVKGEDGGAVLFGPGKDGTHVIMVIDAEERSAYTRLGSLAARDLREWLNTRVR